MSLEPESTVAEGADPHGWRTCHCNELFCRLLSPSLSLSLCVPLSTGHFDNLFSKPEKNWTLSPPRQLCQVLYSEQCALAFALVERIMTSQIYVTLFSEKRPGVFQLIPLHSGRFEQARRVLTEHPLASARSRNSCIFFNICLPCGQSSLEQHFPAFFLEASHMT